MSLLTNAEEEKSNTYNTEDKDMGLLTFAAGSVCGVAGGFMLHKCIFGKTGGQDIDISEITEENDRLKKRVKDMEEQIKVISASNQKYRDEAKDDMDEMDDLEDELQSAKSELRKLKEENAKNEALIMEYKMSVTSLKSEIARLKENK